MRGCECCSSLMCGAGVWGARVQGGVGRHGGGGSSIIVVFPGTLGKVHSVSGYYFIFILWTHQFGAICNHCDAYSFPENSYPFRFEFTFKISHVEATPICCLAARVLSGRGLRGMGCVEWFRGGGCVD